MVSLKDVANACGCSVATVSKALRDQGDIGEETRERVKRVANELGYFPNAAARALKTNQSKNLGVLYMEETGFGLKHEYFAGILQGFKRKAEELGYDITFINIESGGMSYLEHCKYRNFDGVVIVCAKFGDSQVQELMESELPVVTVDYVHYNCTSVSSNNQKGIRELLDYIVDMGHKKIAYIHGQNHSSVTKERLITFNQVAEERGLEIPDEYILEARYREPKDAEEATMKLLELKNPPTCILYPDDTALIGGLNAIRAKGLHIPDDISVAGYDGTEVSQMLMPRLVTIKQDTDQIGREAADRLVKSIEKSKTTFVERVIIGGELLKGESVGKN